jgi:type IV pilus assembly protein PilA
MRGAAPEDPAGRRQAGLTLVELIVVMVIIAILVGVCIPAFLGARRRAADRAAQSALRNALAAAKAIYADSQSYLSADPDNLESEERDYTYLDATTASTDPNSISVNPAASQLWYAAVQSASGTCFYIRETGATSYASGTSTCDGATAASMVYTSSW